MSLPSRDRTIDQCKIDLAGQGSESIAQRLGEPARLENDRAQVGKDRSIGIGAIVLLIADPCDGCQSTIPETLELALYRSPARAGVLENLRGEVGSLRVSVKQSENALLRA